MQLQFKRNTESDTSSVVSPFFLRSSSGPKRRKTESHKHRITIVLHRSRRTTHSNFHGQHGQWHGSGARAPYDDEDVQHGGRWGSHALSIPCQP